MIKAILVTVFAIGTSLVASTSAAAQHWTMTVDIPFDFNVGEAKMPSGTYQVELFPNGQAVAIRSTDYTLRALTLSQAGNRPSASKRGGLAFNKYGEVHFLSKVSWTEGPTRELAPASLEIQIAKRIGRARELDVAVK